MTSDNGQVVESGKLKMESLGFDLHTMVSPGGYKIKDESYKFSLSIIQTYTFLKQKNEYELSKQLLRSGTSIGANIIEAQDAQSKKDFLHKMNIALKEARETHYRLSLLSDTQFLDAYTEIEKVTNKCIELIAVLTKIIKSTKANIVNSV